MFMTNKQIADYLNDKNMTTSRGSKFLDSVVHLVEWKMEKRFLRQQKEEIETADLKIRFDKKEE